MALFRNNDRKKLDRLLADFPALWAIRRRYDAKMIVQVAPMTSDVIQLRISHLVSWYAVVSWQSGIEVLALDHQGATVSTAAYNSINKQKETIEYFIADAGPMITVWRAPRGKTLNQMCVVGC